GAITSALWWVFGCSIVVTQAIVNRGRPSPFRGGEGEGFFAPHHVPCSHPLRYFSCSAVSLSIVTPIDASFSRATYCSISSGTSWTLGPSLPLFFTQYSVASA